MLYLAFFLMGMLQDACGAAWVHNVAKKKYLAGGFAMLWAVSNGFFVLTLASELKLQYVFVYAAGVAVGTILVVWRVKKNESI